MIIQEVTLSSIRSHQLFTTHLHPELTVIVGPNGAGKTTLLETIYVLLRGSSFRGRDRDMITGGTVHSGAKLRMEDGSERRLALTLAPDGKLNKEFTVATKKSSRLPVTSRRPVVLFDPDQLRLITSSPTRRREFIDNIIARLSPTYSTVLSRFNRTLVQRNELLKQYEHMPVEQWESHLFPWDIKLAELGATIIKARRNFLAHSNEHLTRLYRSLAGTSVQTITTEYVSPLSNSSQEALLAQLQHTHHTDAVRGFTSVGPHRDDIAILLNAQPAADIASRGELRTIMLAFKLLEVELQEKHSGEKPLILLDDVFSELDKQREVKLMEALEGYQTIITATDLRDKLREKASIIQL